MLADIFTLIIVLLIGGMLGVSALLIFIYALWAFQDNESDRSHQDALRKNKGDSR
jgi:hypothetical protein